MEDQTDELGITITPKKSIPWYKKLYHKVTRPFLLARLAVIVIKFKLWARYASDPKTRYICSHLYSSTANIYNVLTYKWAPKFKLPQE